MKSAVAYLIFSLITTTESQWPVTRWTSIQYPSWQRCIQERDEFVERMNAPEKVRIRALQGVAVAQGPVCSKEPLHVWISEGEQS